MDEVPPRNERMIEVLRCVVAALRDVFPAQGAAV
jgi:hypothetical protein